MYELFEDAATLSAAGQTIYLYGLAAALGALLMWLTLSILAKKRALPEGTAVLTMALALPLGLFFARAFYCLIDTNFSPIASLNAVFLLSGGGYAMSGALLGAALGGLLASKIMKTGAAKLMDCLVPALLVFILFERLGEGFTTLGLSRPLILDAFKNTFLAQTDEYDAYLRTWILEAAGALILLVFSLRFLKRETRAGNAALKSALLFAPAQVFFESLRYDQHLKFGFVGIQHILSMLLLCAVVIVFAFRALKRGGIKAFPVFSIAVLPILAGLLILIEFMIDRTSVNRFLLYAAYALLLILPAWLGLRLSKERKQ